MPRLRPRGSPYRSPSRSSPFLSEQPQSLKLASFRSQTLSVKVATVGSYPHLPDRRPSLPVRRNAVRATSLFPGNKRKKTPTCDRKRQLCILYFLASPVRSQDFVRQSRIPGLGHQLSSSPFFPSFEGDQPPLIWQARSLVNRIQ